jgi:hypothetical protein
MTGRLACGFNRKNFKCTALARSVAARSGTCYVTETLTRAPWRGPTSDRYSAPAFIGRQRDPSKSPAGLRFVLHIDFDKDFDTDFDKDLGNKASRLVSSFTFSPNGNA